jgi:hypothetical protein
VKPEEASERSAIERHVRDHFFEGFDVVFGMLESIPVLRQLVPDRYYISCQFANKSRGQSHKGISSFFHWYLLMV